MSRHRNYRNYSYEDDMSEDVYGHSVEDYDMAVSPTTVAQFMYRRTNSRDASELGHYMGCVVEEEGEESEEDDHLTHSQDYKRPQLDAVSEAKLSSCLDQLHSILGETCHEPTAVEAVLKYNFDVEKALDDILNGGSKKEPKSLSTKPSSSKGQSLEGACGVISDMPDSQRQQVLPDLENVTPVRKREAETKATPARTVSSSKDKLKVGFATPVLDKSSDQSSPERPSSTDSDPSKSPEIARTRSKVKDQVDKKAEIKRREKEKALLNLVVIGHVDAGKSTLMGHVLFLLGDVSKKAMHKYETESRKAGKASFAFAWVLDETGEERERGITMDVGLTKFETKSKVITLMDAPGHKDFIPNMITGAAQADVAILVVDASTGEFEAGFEAGGQTREHALLVRSLGVTQMIVAVNKLDNVGWSEERYNHIVGKMKAFLKQAGFKAESEVVYLPCSGLSGENLASTPKEPILTSWYNGPCLVDRIDQFKRPQRPLDKPFRLCVSDVYKGMGAGVSVMGKIEAGIAQTGEKILVMPAGEQGIIKGFTVHDEVAQCACAGDHVSATLGGLDMMHIGVGSILCDPSSPIKATTKLKARIIVFNIEVPITKGFMVLFHYQALSEPAVVKHLVSVLHKSTGEVIQKRPRCLTKNTNAEVIIHTSRPVCVEIFKDYKDLGRFMLRYGGNTIAAGVVIEILS